MPEGTVYLIHFAEGLHITGNRYATHYLGWALNVDARLKEHRGGCGAKLIAEINRRGIPWTLARVWNERDRHFERSLKNQRQAPRLCPCCAGHKAYRLQVATPEELAVALDAIAWTP